VTVTWLLPAVARTSETGSGHSRIKVSGASVGLPEPLGLGLVLGRAVELGRGLVLGRAVELGRGLVLGLALGLELGLALGLELGLALGLVLGLALGLAGEGSAVEADAEISAEGLLEFAGELVDVDEVALGVAESTSFVVADGEGVVARSRKASDAVALAPALALADD
jgi:hypothetical protein